MDDVKIMNTHRGALFYPAKNFQVVLVLGLKN
jgi:hypothetical protein